MYVAKIKVLISCTLAQLIRPLFMLSAKSGSIYVETFLVQVT